jgi:outer membrane protein TolC
MHNKILVVPFLFFLGTTTNALASLSLDDYLKQVEKNNQTVIANKMIIEATSEREDEGRLLFKPSLFAQAQMSVDKKPVNNVAAQGDQTNYEALSAGVFQNFESGLKAQAGYTFLHTNIKNASSTFVPTPDYNDGSIKLELTQSLWRNWAGLETKGQSTIIDAQAKASKLTASFSIKSIIAQAESLYWSLSQTNKIIKVQEDNIKRAQQIRSWNQRRSSTGLGDKADFYQADSNLRLREFELSNALQSQNLLRRSFNSLRGIDGNELTESLDSIDTKNLKSLSLPEKMALREDTKAALELQSIAKSNSQLAIERNKPTLELFGSYALNGRDKEKSKALSKSIETDHTTSVVGLKLSTPLDFFSTDKNIESYKKEQNAADFNYQKKVFDQDKEWNDLVTKFNDTKIKLDLVANITEAQKIKSANERNRLNNGRTTTFQVLNFESDLAAAELLKIQTETELLNIYSQLKIFSAGGAK